MDSTLCQRGFGHRTCTSGTPADSRLLRSWSGDSALAWNRSNPGPMRRYAVNGSNLVCCVLLLLSGLAHAGRRAAAGGAAVDTEARQAWMAGFVKYEDAGRAEKTGDTRLALKLYRESRETFEAVRQKFPEWNASLITYRINCCGERIQCLESGADRKQKQRGELVDLARAYTDKIASLVQQNRELQEELGRTSAALEQLRREAARSTASTGDASDLVARNKRLREQLGIQEQRVATLVAALESATDGRPGEGERKAREQLASAHSRLAEIELKLDTYRRAYGNVKRHGEVAEDERSVLATENVALKTLVQTYEQDVSAYEADVALLQARNRELREGSRELRERCRRSSVRLAALEAADGPRSDVSTPAEVSGDEHAQSADAAVAATEHRAEMDRLNAVLDVLQAKNMRLVARLQSIGGIRPAAVDVAGGAGAGTTLGGGVARAETGRASTSDDAEPVGSSASLPSGHVDGGRAAPTEDVAARLRTERDQAVRSMTELAGQLKLRNAELDRYRAVVAELSAPPVTFRLFPLNCVWVRMSSPRRLDHAIP